ncbi:flagellar protein FlaG [Ponticaulis sp.]|uniref:flagellar protein FlaG n=1 Tax=Ponticaulis sp. TaxID=2020902 RepID=UPI000B70F526|nr:flagellar protein FlaG [Ponticaulis sp.]MAJ09923.1 hypothetical protein [Ponticaulis sp.]RPG18533.1 MAG: flagellar protein FlaG [Hyphomonadaceae bacterium TMED125]HBH89734.1 hypothetical protein [Hyphomonadaceae bacterium]HBJ94872.1 hypothetical protein [Hyphomonadaceae bacterium]|tara:strand:- start:6740 stop:7117 length:378 start_codon:yes stop_codon:yes gene_type:complete
MSGDLKLTPVSGALAADIKQERFAFREASGQEEQSAASDVRKAEDAETTDPAEQRRQLLKEALEETQNAPDGKLVIERDEDTGKYVQKVLDPTSGEVLKQWPEEQFLELAKSMGEAYGLIVDRQV